MIAASQKTFSKSEASATSGKTGEVPTEIPREKYIPEKKDNKSSMSSHVYYNYYIRRKLSIRKS